jgi:hypothetical protein
MLTAHFHLTHRLRINGVLPPLLIRLKYVVLNYPQEEPDVTSLQRQCSEVYISDNCTCHQSEVITVHCTRRPRLLGTYGTSDGSLLVQLSRQIWFSPPVGCPLLHSLRGLVMHC